MRVLHAQFIDRVRGQSTNQLAHHNSGGVLLSTVTGKSRVRGRIDCRLASRGRIQRVVSTGAEANVQTIVVVNRPVNTPQTGIRVIGLDVRDLLTLKEGKHRLLRRAQSNRTTASASSGEISRERENDLARCAEALLLIGAEIKQLVFLDWPTN